MKTCLPICVSTTEEVEEALRSHQEAFDAFEIWLDYLNDLELERLRSLISAFPKEILLLFRRKNLEPSHTPLEKRFECIDALQSSKLHWDFDIQVQEEELEYFVQQDREASLICSYHNYSRTPADEELSALLQRMEKFRPAIVKFACFVEKRRDALRLLQFQLALTESQKDAVVLGMGEQAMITRVFAREFGGAYLFLMTNKDKKLASTAPGQLTVEDFERVEKICGLGNGRK